MKLYRYKSHAIDLNTICHMQKYIVIQPSFDAENTKWYHLKNSFKILEQYCIYLYCTLSGNCIKLLYDSEQERDTEFEKIYEIWKG